MTTETSLATALRLTPSAGDNGETFTLTVEDVSSEWLFLAPDRTARVKVWELDARAPDTQEHEADQQSDDLLAEFDVEIGIEQTPDGANVYFEKVQRADAGPTAVPKAKPRTVEHDGQSWTLKFDPGFVPPHFELAFEGAGGADAGKHTILLQSEPKEREHYVFELGCTLELQGGGKCYGSSAGVPARLLCHGMLRDNLVAATEMFPRDHFDLFKQRGVGARYGSQYVAYLKGRRDDGDITQAQFDQRVKQHRDDQKKYGTESSSCIVYVLDAMTRGHVESLAEGDWHRIMEFYRAEAEKKRKSPKARGPSGVDLARGLERAGWLGIFFCPDTRHAWQDDTKYAFKYAYARAKRQGDHHAVLTVHDRVVDYEPTSKTRGGTTIPAAKRTKQDTTKLKWLYEVPIGVINLHGGTHTALWRGYPGKGEGYVYEVHWSASARNQSSMGNLYRVYDKTPLTDYRHWTSGIVHVPPGTWPPPGAVKKKGKAAP